MEIYKVALQGCGFVNWLNFNQPMTFNEDLVLTQVYETLFNINEWGNIELGLAAKYHVHNNNLVITIKQRNFHDGTPLTAQDVLHSLTQALNSPYKHNNNGWTGDLIKLTAKSLKLINSQQLQIQLYKNALQDILKELSKVKYSIKKGRLGTGPYQIDQFQTQDQKLILKKDTSHPNSQQCVDELHLIGYKNNFETLKAFINKEVDQVRIWGLQSPFQYNPNTLMIPSKTFYASFFQFNTQSKNFNCRKNRQHFKNTFLKNIMLHNNYPWNPFSGVIPKDSFQPPTQVLSLSKNRTVTFGVAHKRQKKEVERLIDRKFFQNTGYKIKIKNYESYKNLYNSDADLIYTAFSYEQNNKHKLPEICHSQHKKNKTKYKNKNLNELISKDLKAAEEFINNESLLIPLGWFQCHILTHKDSSIFCGIKNNKVTPVLYKSKLTDFIELFSKSQNELFKLREKNWSQLSQKSKIKEVMTQFKHDIQSPLSVLRLMSQDISNSQDIYQRVLKRVQEFHHNIEKEIVNSSETQKQIQIEKDTLNINEALREIIHEQQQKNLTQPNIEILTNLEADQSLVNIDCGKFKRLISNLLNNAVESRDKWKHQIHIHTQNDSKVLITTIKDNGKGFSKEHLKAVLQAPKVSSKSSGQGLGLYNAKSYIESLGGEFNISSQQHRGTTISLKLQLHCVLTGDQGVDGVQKFGT